METYRYMYMYVVSCDSHTHYSDPSNYNMSKVNRSVTNDPAARMQNLQLLVNRIKHFYLTALQQLIITSLPKIAVISMNPHDGMCTCTGLLCFCTYI